MCFRMRVFQIHVIFAGTISPEGSTNTKEHRSWHLALASIKVVILSYFIVVQSVNSLK